MSVLFHMLQEADQGRAARAEHAGAAADELLLRELLLHVAQHVRSESGGRGGARGAGAQIGLQHRADVLRAVGNRAGVRFFRILLEATAPLPGGEGIEPHYRGVARIESSV